jgi:chromosome partitioning protein
MHIMTLATQKGGSGKSTLAACVAVAAEAEGIKTAVLDTDPQGSVFKWGERRKAEMPAVDRCEPHQLATVLKSLPKQGFELVIIDTAGAHNASVAPALQAADFCLVPVRPTLTDLEAAIPTAKQLLDRKTRFAFVLSQCFGSSSRTNDAATGLLRHGEVAPANVFHRADYTDAYTTGLGVTEYNSHGKAAQEIRLLWAWLARTIGERT